MFRIYTYIAKIESVYDGDTFTVLIDLGFDLWYRTKLRLAWVNTPEVRGKEKIEGKKVRDYVRTLIEGKIFEITTYKRGKFGRIISDIKLNKDETLSQHLLKLNFAKKVDY